MTASFRDRIERVYDSFFRDPVFHAFVNHSGYANYGLWDESTRSGEEACDNLVDRLIGFLPTRSGRILDVACGHGGTTARLMRSFPPDQITAGNLSRQQLRATARRAPGCQLVQLDAAELPFADGSFDHIVCIEAAFHFQSRQRFFRQAWRVLRPGGHLVLTDILARIGAGRIPRENLFRSLPEYRDQLCRAGFEDIEVIDKIENTWRTFRRRYSRFASRTSGVTRLRRLPALPRLLFRYLVTSYAIKGYLLAHARKP